MKLALTSNGLTNKKIINAVKYLLDKPLFNNKVIMLSSGPRSEKVLGYIKEYKEPFIKMGLKDENITVIFMNEENNINI